MTRTAWHTAASATGAALCWMLALAMATSNVQAFFHPAWLASLWYVPWLLTGALALAWATCRAFDKATTTTQPPQQPSSSRGERGTGMDAAA